MNKNIKSNNRRRKVPKMETKTQSRVLFHRRIKNRWKGRCGGTNICNCITNGHICRGLYTGNSTKDTRSTKHIRVQKRRNWRKWSSRVSQKNWMSEHREWWADGTCLRVGFYASNIEWVNCASKASGLYVSGVSGASQPCPTPLWHVPVVPKYVSLCGCSICLL